MAKRIGAALALLLFALSAYAGNDGVQTMVGATPVKVEIYGTSWCGYCKMAKKFFTSRKIPFVEYDVEKDEQAHVRFRKMNPQGGVPFVVIGAYGIPGYQEKAYMQAIELSLAPQTAPDAAPGSSPAKVPAK